MSRIYSATEYVPPEETEVGTLKLEIISQWDFITKPVCYETVPNGTVFPLALRKCIGVISKDHTKWEYVEKPTKEMEQTLMEQGYEVAARAL